MVAWDLPHKPIPKDMTPAEIGEMYAVDHKCPNRDGFDKKTELQWLDIDRATEANHTDPVEHDIPCDGCGQRVRSCVCGMGDDVQ